MMNVPAVMHPAGCPLPFFEPFPNAKKSQKRLVSRHFRCNTHRGARIKDDVWIEKTLPTLIQTNETKKSTQIDAFFESKPKIDAFLKIDANAQRQEYKMAS